MRRGLAQEVAQLVGRTALDSQCGPLLAQRCVQARVAIDESQRGHAHLPLPAEEISPVVRYGNPDPSWGRVIACHHARNLPAALGH